MSNDKKWRRRSWFEDCHSCNCNFSCYNKSHAEISMTLTEIYCQTAICFLPLRLRAERTFLPPFVLILDLNPCTFARCLFLGWYVILAIDTSSFKWWICSFPGQEELLNFSKYSAAAGNWSETMYELFPCPLSGLPGLYRTACGCGRKSHIPSCIRKKAVPAAPALPGCGYGCCFGHSIPL